MIGNNPYNEWYDKYVTDVWARIEHEEIEIVIENEMVEKVFKRNLNYNPNEEYIPREQYREWVTIGMFGKLAVKDNGIRQEENSVLQDKMKLSHIQMKKLNIM